MKTRNLILIFSPFLCPCGTALAASSTDSVCLEEVTVTAIKQSDNLRLQATALTQLLRGDVERNSLRSLKQVADMVPNFFVPDYGSRMTSTIYVRGLGARIDQPAVGLNVDNVPVLCKENYDFDLMDISRVEMMRGPQSSLYGRNTMAGVINIYTLSPFNYQGTRLLAEYGSRNSKKWGVSHYAKVNNQLGLAGGIYYTSTDGEFINQHNGQKTDWEHQGTGHMKIDWLANPTLRVSNTLILSSTRQGGYPYESVATGAIAYNDTCFYRRTALLDGLTIKKELNNFTLSSITSYQYINDNMTLDQDFTTAPYFTLTQARKEHGVTQDLVARHKQKNYECITGLFGFFRHYKMNAPVTFRDAGIANLIEGNVNKALPSYPITWDSRHFVLGSNFTYNDWGAAIYHQSALDWHDFTITAGLRLDYERASLHYHSETHTGYTITEKASGNIFAHENIDIDDRGTLSNHYLQLLPKLAVTYHLNGNNFQTLYASVSKGYKAGGFNTQMFSDVLQQKLMGMMGIGASYDVDKIVSYKPEKAWNFEVGSHIDCWNHRVKSDIGLFFMDCTDRQLTVFPDGTTTGRVMTNAGKTRSWGAEIAINTTPLDNTGINLSYGYTHATFVNYNDGKHDYKGNYVPYSPSHTLHAEAFHTFHFDKGNQWLQSLTLNANTRAAGKIYWNEANTLHQPFYAQLGASATLAGKHYSLELWGRNLTGTRFNTFYFMSIGHEFLQRGHGRTIGATLKIEIK